MKEGRKLSAHATETEWREVEAWRKREGRSNSHIDTLDDTVLGLIPVQGDVRLQFVVRRVR